MLPFLRRTNVVKHQHQPHLVHLELGGGASVEIRQAGRALQLPGGDAKEHPSAGGLDILDPGLPAVLVRAGDLVEGSLADFQGTLVLENIGSLPMCLSARPLCSRM